MEPPECRAIRAAAEAIAPLHEPIRPHGCGDWLDEHPEPGQTFDQYRRGRPVLPDGRRTSLYVQPLGDFAPSQLPAIEAAADLLGRFYGLEVRRLDPMGTDFVCPEARRPDPFTGEEQLLTGLILDRLREVKPADAVAVLAPTASDLWPAPGWNFVFGEASLRDGVGVWSLHRMGDPEYEPRTFLRRTAQTAVHEAGHMFGIRHCTRHHCGMNGANSQDEADGQPLWFCPEDEQKVWWGMGVDPLARYGRLVEFAEAWGLKREANFWRLSEAALRGEGLAKPAPMPPHPRARRHGRPGR